MFDTPLSMPYDIRALTPLDTPMPYEFAACRYRYAIRFVTLPILRRYVSRFATCAYAAKTLAVIAE